jgi:polyhydroxybutyrate depolymerase
MMLALVLDESAAVLTPTLAVESRVEVQGLDRGYLLFVPRDLPPGPRPLVLLFHGEGGVPRGTEEYFGMDEIAGDGGFLVAYLEGLEKSWDDGRGIAPGGTRGTDDVAFVRAVVDQIASRNPVDRSRVFAAGMSTGGMFCHRLAAEAPDLIAAIAPVCAPIARPYIDEFRLDRPISLFALLGDADPIIPLGGGFVYPGGLQRRGEVSGLDETLAHYLAAAGIEGGPEVQPVEDPVEDGTSTERWIYPVGIGGTRVVVGMVRGGGHGLPGRVRSYPEWAVGKSSKDFDGSRAIWDFFASCPPLFPRSTATADRASTSAGPSPEARHGLHQ